MGTWMLQITDEKEGDIAECIDRPWEYSFIDEDTGAEQTLTCATLRDDITDCDAQLEPEIAQLEFEGTALVDACCRCGGGYPELPNTLISWSLVIYGREVALVTTTPPPTQRPNQTDDQFTIQNADGTTVQILSNGTTSNNTNSSLPTLAPVQLAASIPAPMQPTSLPTAANNSASTETTSDGKNLSGALGLSLAIFAVFTFK